MSYEQKMAKKNRIPYIRVEKIFIGDFGTYLQNTGDGTYKISSPSSQITVDSYGKIDISGSQSVSFGGKDLNFTELPNRFIRPSGISWSAVTSHSHVIGVIPIKVGGKRAYIPFLNVDL